MLLCLQGASPEEVRRKLNSAALSGSLRDDVEGFGTFDPEGNQMECLLECSPADGERSKESITPQLHPCTGMPPAGWRLLKARCPWLWAKHRM